MRSWLNSDASAGNVEWLCGNPPSAENIKFGYNPYADEAGFLTNFSEDECAAMQTAKIKSLVGSCEWSKHFYTTGSAKHEYNHDIDSVVQNYKTAYAETVTDTIFLLDVQQVNTIYKNTNILGDEYFRAELTGGFNNRAIQRIAEGNNTLADKIATGLRRAKAQIKQAYSKGNYTNAQGLQLTFEQLNNAEKAYIQGLEQARGNTAENGEVRYSLKEETTTPQFKNWFGDWQNDPENASKVVNKDGTPKVVYHGTKAKFTAFDKSTFGKNMFNAFGKGFYFTDKKSVTKSYGNNVIKAYLSIKNPYYASDSEATRLRTEELIAKGYDGVIINTAPNEHIYVAFEPTQIKSATDNIGTFDKTNPDIRYSVKEGGNEADINEIVNSDMPADEKRKNLEDRAHFVPQGGRDLYAEARQRGKEHFDKMHKVKPSEYSEDDWKSYGEDFGTDNMRQDMQQRAEEAERRDREAFNERFDKAFPNSQYSEEDWDNLSEPVSDNYDWTKDGRNWSEPQEKPKTAAELDAEADETTRPWRTRRRTAGPQRKSLISIRVHS